MNDIRKAIMERLGFAAGDKAAFAENVTYSVAVHIGDQPAGERSTKSLDEAKAYAKSMLQTAKANAKGKPVVVDVYPVVNYEPKAAVMTLHASRPGAKAKFAITKEQIRGASREELRSIEQRLQALAKSGDKNAAALLDYVEEEYNDRYRGTHSRPGAKAKMSDEGKAIAEEILRQLGGGRFRMMVGGKNVYHGNFGGKPGMQMDIGRGAKDGINRLIVTLDRGSDTYDMEFWRIANRGMTTKKVAEASGVYADALQRVFTSKTGFNTSLFAKGDKAKMGTNKEIAQRLGSAAKFANEEAQMRELIGQLGQKPDKVIYKYGAFEMHFYGRAGKGDGEQRARRTLANLHAFMRRTGLDTHGAYYQPIDDRDPSQGGMIVLLASTFDKFSRPGAKAKFANGTDSFLTIKGVRYRIAGTRKDSKGNLVYDLHGTSKTAHPVIYTLVKFLDDQRWVLWGAQGQEVARGKMEASRPGAKATAAKADDKTDCAECDTDEAKAGLKIMSAADPAVSEKIRTLMREGKPQDQAVAIALDMKRRGEL